MSVVEQREEWLAQRVHGIGGTDIAAIVNRSPWKNPLDVYLGKLGLTEWEQPNEAMRWGSRLEALIAEEYGRQMDVPVARGTQITGLFSADRCAAWDDQVIVRHERHPVVIGTPDGIVPMLDRGLEIKNVSFQGQEWGNHSPMRSRCTTGYRSPGTWP